MFELARGWTAINLAGQKARFEIDFLLSTFDFQPLANKLARIDEAGLALIRYPNETLLLQALIARLPPARAGAS